MSISILPYDPIWADKAEAEIAHWRAAAGTGLVAMHHIGSTSVPGLSAKPIIDLMPVAPDDAGLDDLRYVAEFLGYEWMGEYGLPGRRYCRKDDPQTGARQFQAHCYADGDAEALRHLAFRDALRMDAELVRDYAAIKQHCARLHPDDQQAYGRCKSSFIDAAEARALERLT